MGLGNLFGGPKYAALAEDSSEARQIAQSAAFESFVKVANDRIEVVPGEDALFAFVGKPPKAFGIVWFFGDERRDVPTMVRHGIVTRESAARLAEDLRGIYEANTSVTRFEHRVAGHRVVVAPSEQMHAEIRKALEHAAS